jgi:hypothetical protein
MADVIAFDRQRRLQDRSKTHQKHGSLSSGAAERLRSCNEHVRAEPDREKEIPVHRAPPILGIIVICVTAIALAFVVFHLSGQKSFSDQYIGVSTGITPY